MTISDQTKQTVSKAVLAGAILSASTSMIYGNGSVNFLNMDIPAAVPMFIAGSGASLVTDVVANQFKLETSSSKRIANVSSLAASSAIAAVSAVAILKVSTQLPNDSIPRIVGLAALSQAGSDYIESKYLTDVKGKFIF